jgi:hypothetical protein
VSAAPALGLATTAFSAEVTAGADSGCGRHRPTKVSNNKQTARTTNRRRGDIEEWIGPAPDSGTAP